MKVVLLKDVRDLGKKNQVLEVSDGYARNFLFKNKMAVAATDGSMRRLDLENLNEKLKQDQLASDAEIMKKRLEQIVVECSVKAGSAGRTFGTVSTKQIVQALKEQHNIVIDKRKINMDNMIIGLGYNNIPVELYRGVIGTIKVHVTEK